MKTIKKRPKKPTTKESLNIQPTDNKVLSNKRIPRPLGTTELSKSLHQNTVMNSNESNTLQSLIEHITKHYINTNFKYCNQSQSIEHFSSYTNIPISYIQTLMVDQAKIGYSLLTNEGQEDIGGAIFSLLLNMSLSDRSTALQHANILTTAMGQQYVPFLSSEVTKALANAQSTTQNIANIARNFFGNQGSGLTINNVQSNAHNVQNNLTIENAQMMIEDQLRDKALLQDQATKDNLYLQYELHNMPELDARKQTGLDTSKEGLDFGKVADAILITDEEEGIKDLQHTDRRAHQHNIDLEADGI